jgi:hypothetical protein
MRFFSTIEWDLRLVLYWYSTRCKSDVRGRDAGKSEKRKARTVPKLALKARDVPVEKPFFVRSSSNGHVVVPSGS